MDLVQDGRGMTSDGSSRKADNSSINVQVGRAVSIVEMLQTIPIAILILAMRFSLI